jgi:tRNA modification GTPase
MVDGVIEGGTIVAIATPPGRGGIGVIRISGSNAVAIAQKLTGISDLKPRYAHYVSVKNLDSGLMLYFPGPNSFTGEDVIELQMHGAPIVLDAIVGQCIKHGARIANPGEFSLRAFLNNKIDLIQAEAIADLINAQSKQAARAAIRSLQGEFSKLIQALNQKFLHLRMYIEAAIDFSDEDIAFESLAFIKTNLQELRHELDAILTSAQQGSKLQDSITIAIAGPPNAGKSTLMNICAKRDVAIVTAIPGTTRDVMREHVLLNGLPVCFIDTAGLHASQDMVEQEGIRRALKVFQEADIILLMVDGTNADYLRKLDEIRAQLPQDRPIIEIINKIDLLGKMPTCGGKSVTSMDPAHKAREDVSLAQEDVALAQEDIALAQEDIALAQEDIALAQEEGAVLSPDDGALVPEDFSNTIYMSALHARGIDLLEQKIAAFVNFNPQESNILARRRHLDALEQVNALLQAGEAALLSHQALELLAEDLRESYQILGSITGEFTADDLLGLIFSTFCIGK